MNNVNKKDECNHEVIIKDRARIEITGVKKIESLNSEQFFINTTMEDLIIYGENLEMLHLDIEKGHLWVTGYVFGFEYINHTGKSGKKKSSFVGKIFK